jgi:2-polyprenyl-3-methyl-5-hydroxy-6-metoxy-1,4-benzoquinol methylase/glycosyltransferase involved in cell wall biosynthesis
MVSPASKADGATPLPLAVVMISLNEAHNMEAVLANLRGFASEIFLVDSFSSDETVEIALRHGVHVVQRRFQGFGDQWNYALDNLPITAPWTMKLDPDERLTDELKAAIRSEIAEDRADAITLTRRLWFMGRPLSVRQDILRLWRTGTCRFSDVLVNEHPIVSGARMAKVRGDLEHHDSPNLQHWVEKQNAYTTADALSERPNLFGSALSRRMWMKQNYSRLPFRFVLMELYCLLVQGAWRAGRVGFIWAKLRSDVYRLRAYKLTEMQLTGVSYQPPKGRTGPPHPGAIQADGETRRISKVRSAAHSCRAIAYHETLAAGWEARYTRGGLRRRALFFETAILPRLSLAGRWLDAGCGSGYFSRLLARSGAEVLGVDGSSAMIEAANQLTHRAHGDGAVSFEVGVVESLPAKLGPFDGVLCLSVLEYVDDPDRTLGCLADLLAPGGRLVLSVPNRNSTLRGLQRLARPLLARNGGQVFDYLDMSVQDSSKQDLERLVESRGLVCEAVLGFDPLIPQALHTALPPSLLFLIARKPTAEMVDP